MLVHFTPLVALLPTILACADHSYSARSIVQKRMKDSDILESQWSTRNISSRDWAYEASYDWGRVNPDYELCQTGTQQSPINLRTAAVGNKVHTPVFTGYDGEWQGQYFNWGYGAAFNIDHPKGDYSQLPSMEYDNHTVYMTGWHIHAPADHRIDGESPKAELHFVHVDAKGKEKAVLGFMMDPAGDLEGTTYNSSWVDQLPTTMLHFGETHRQLAMPMRFDLALDEVKGFEEFWTYKGSLTSPPCTEGKRWFVARETMWTSVPQMREILRVSTFSARAVQREWLHDLNL
ncbi:carbonic anhydrase [Diplodia corticola]|uniref:Carbonic anhydrase n=1 Tax=Diplodia corticola TaxID=236234 RepID=A0A1J9S3K3_9PEZI|nr:carbonic anhydrase [Diplodia corticola]OJD35135.1 carbonic anhydrase [Diplodia corticola]